MAQAMAGFCGSSQAVLEGSLGSTTRLNMASSGSRLSSVTCFTVKAQHVEPQSSRRGVIGLVAAGLATGSFVQAVFADAIPIKVGPPPPPSGGLRVLQYTFVPELVLYRKRVNSVPLNYERWEKKKAGTLNSDEARDLELPLKQRFFLQPLTPSEAAQRTKESAKEIVAVKKFIDKKAWPSVQNDLRLRAEYLRYDLNTIISSKPKEEKQPLKELTGKLLQNINNLDHAAKVKSTPEAEKYYAETVSTLNDVLAKLG